MKERSEVHPKILTLVTVNTRKKFRFQGKGNTFSFNVINLCDILKVIFVVIFLKNNLKPFLSGGIQSVSEVHRNHQSVLDSELHLIV